MNVRLDSKSTALLDELARFYNRPKTEMVSLALKSFWRRWLLEEHNRAYAALAADPAKWKEEIEERKLWDNTLTDGLERGGS